MAQKVEYTILDLIETSAKNSKTAPLNLGGIGGMGGGVGGPPGGFIGRLPQYNVTYDMSELATLDTAPSGVTGSSGWSLVDNLNHIRYRLETLESGGGGGGSGSGILIIDDNTSSNYPNVDTIHFIGSGVIITDLGGGSVQVEIDATGTGNDSTVFNVMSYGATGDGTSDDTIAVQAAINAANSGGGGVVWFPVGVYSCSALTLYSSISIRGASEWASIIKARSSGSLLTMHSTVSRTELGVFKDIQIDGNSTGTDGIDLIGSDRVYMQRVFATNFTNAGVLLQGTLVASFEDCLFLSNKYGVKGDSYTLSGGMGYQAANLVQFKGCSFNANSTHGLHWENGALLSILDCNIDSNGTNGDSSTGGIYFKKGSTESSTIGLHMTGSWFEANWGDADVIIDETSASGIKHIIESSLFNPNAHTTYGIKLVAATYDTILSCSNVMFNVSHASGAFFANGTHATILLDNCVGSTAGTGTIIIETSHDAVTVLDTTTIDLTLTGQQIQADLKDTTVASGLYTNATIVIDSQGRITSAIDGGTGATVLHMYNEICSGIPTRVFNTIQVYASGTLRVYYNGIRQVKGVHYTDDIDFNTFSTYFDTYSGEYIIVDYDYLDSDQIQLVDSDGILIVDSDGIQLI